jgi:hypothetical protein
MAKKSKKKSVKKRVIKAAKSLGKKSEEGRQENDTEEGEKSQEGKEEIEALTARGQLSPTIAQRLNNGHGGRGISKSNISNR